MKYRHYLQWHILHPCNLHCKHCYQDDYSADDIENCAFGRHLEARGDARTYDIVHGGQAFYHKLVTDLRDFNVSMKITN